MFDTIIAGAFANIASHSFIKFFERKDKVSKNSKDTKSKKISAMQKNNNLKSITKGIRIEDNCIENSTTAISIQGNCNNLSITGNTSIGCDKMLDINGQNHQDINIQNNKFIK